MRGFSFALLDTHAPPAWYAISSPASAAFRTHRENTAMTQPHTGLDRRRFLQLGAAAALGLAAGSRLAFAADKDDPFGGFTLGAQSYTFRHFDLEETLKRIKDLGLHYVEFYQKHVPLESTPEQLAAILKLCKEYEVTPLAWGVQSFTKDTDKNRKSFELGKALGLKMLSADPTRTASTASTSCATNTRSPSASIRTGRRATICIAGTRPKSSWRP